MNIGLIIGLALAYLGAALNIIGAVGLHRFREFYRRLHAATVVNIGGTFYPLIGLGIVAASVDWPMTFKMYYIGIAVTTALFAALASAAGSHALARGAYRSGEAKPQVWADKLEEKTKPKG